MSRVRDLLGISGCLGLGLEGGQRLLSGAF